MSETAEISGGRIEEVVCEDRFSTLPEHVIVTILLSIPIKEAVATMILSKRWRFIWTMMPVLNYKENNNANALEDDYYNDDDEDDDEDEDENKKSVWWFLDKSMELHKAPVLGILSIKLGPQCPIDADVGKWVANAVERHVSVLFFKLRWSADPTRLPNKLYTCKTLEHLKLSHKILVDFPSYSCLPSLRNLDLHYVMYKDEASLVMFLSSCPVLETLRVKRKEDDNVAKFSVKVPSLCILSYENFMSLPDDNDVIDTGRCLVIDTPALRKILITDYSGDSCSIENMPCLEYAYIKVGSFPDIDKLLRSLSAVLSLGLCLLTDQMALCWKTVYFARLVECRICPRDSDWMDSLVSLLQNTPKLIKFTVDYRSTYQAPNASLSWSESSYDPPKCLASSLEKFKLKDYGGRDEEEELVAYILENSKCLKTATISLRSNLEDEETMIEQLKAIPRVSITSQLLFKT